MRTRCDTREFVAKTSDEAVDDSPELRLVLGRPVHRRALLGGGLMGDGLVPVRPGPVHRGLHQTEDQTLQRRCGEG